MDKDLDNLQFSLEEIIAEVKSGGLAPLDPPRPEPLPGSAEPVRPQRPSKPREEPPAHKGKTPLSPARGPSPAATKENPRPEPPLFRTNPAQPVSEPPPSGTSLSQPVPSLSAPPNPSLSGTSPSPAVPSGPSLSQQAPSPAAAPQPEQETELSGGVLVDFSTGRIILPSTPPAGRADIPKARPDRSAPWRTTLETVPDLRDHLPAEEDEPRPSLDYDLLNTPYDDAALGAKKSGRKTRSLTLRLFFMLPFVLAPIYLILATTNGFLIPFGLTYLHRPYLFLLALSFAQAVCMGLAYDVMASGLWRLCKLRPTMDSLVLFACAATYAHTLSIILKPEWGGWLPYTCVSGLLCFFALLGKRQRMSALRRNYKLFQMTGSPLAVKEKDGAAVKTGSGAFVEPTALSTPDTAERLSALFAPLLMLACLLFAVLSSFGQGRPQSFFWALSAISVTAVPCGLLLSASLPRHRVVKKLFSSGCALISDETMARLGRCESAILTDVDLFAHGSVVITNIKIPANFTPHRVLTGVCGAVSGMDGGLSHAFLELLKKEYLTPPQAENIACYESGGISADVGGDRVMVGTINFLLRMGVMVGESFQLPGAVFAAINSTFAGVFSVKYVVQPQPHNALGLLDRLKVKPILAVRDFNLAPSFVERMFDFRPDHYDYPDVGERAALADPDYAAEEPALALLTRDSVLAFAEAVAGSRRVRSATLFNLVFTLIGSAVGLMLMYFVTTRMAPASATPGMVLLYQLCWALPVYLRSLLASAF